MSLKSIADNDFSVGDLIWGIVPAGDGNSDMDGESSLTYEPAILVDEWSFWWYKFPPLLPISAMDCLSSSSYSSAITYMQLLSIKQSNSLQIWLMLLSVFSANYSAEDTLLTHFSIVVLRSDISRWHFFIKRSTCSLQV